MTNILPQSILLFSVLGAVACSGCQRHFVDQQLSVAEFLTKSDESVEMLFGIGRMSERNGKTSKAIEAFQSVLEAQPDHADAMHRIGVIKAQQGLIDESIAWMEKASQAAEPSAELIGDMGYVLYLSGDLPASKTMLENGLQLKPNDARMTNNLAIVTGAMEQYNESMNLLRQNGTEAEALASIAYIQTQGGHIDAAKKSYIKSLELDGKLEVAANALIQLDQNSNSPNGPVGPIGPPQNIEMPSSVQLAAFHQPETSEQIKVTPPENKVFLATAVSPLTQVPPGTKNVSEKQSTVRDSNRSVEPERLSMESQVDAPHISQSGNNTATNVKGRLQGPAKIAIGEESRFHLFVENPTAEAVSIVEVELTLDALTEITSVSQEAWQNEKTQSVVWDFDTLAAGEVRKIDFDTVSSATGTQTQRLTIKVNGQPVGELSLDTKVE